MEIRKDDMAVIEAASRDGVHHSLKNICIQPGRLVATDGRILAIREVPFEEGEEPFDAYVIEAKALKAAANGGGYLIAGLNGKATFLAASEKNGRFEPSGSETTISKAEERFPDYMRVVPDENREGQKTAQLDPANLVRLLKAFKGINIVRITILDEQSAIRLDGQSPNGRKVVGVIMPMVTR